MGERSLDRKEASGQAAAQDPAADSRFGDKADDVLPQAATEYQRFLNDHIATRFDAIRPFSEALVTAIAAECELAPNKTALDVGCGPGFYTIPIQLQSGAKLYGLDASPKMIATARDIDEQQKVEWVTGDIAGYVNPDHFDALFATNVMHQLFERGQGEKALEKFHELLKPGAPLAIAYCAREDMERQPHASLFPGVLERAAKRAKPVERLPELIEHYGFRDIKVTQVAQPVDMTVDVLIRNGEERGTSTLEAMYQESPDSFGVALDEFRHAVQRRYAGSTAVDYLYSLTLLTARRAE